MSLEYHIQIKASQNVLGYKLGSYEAVFLVIDDIK